MTAPDDNQGLWVVEVFAAGRWHATTLCNREEQPAERIRKRRAPNEVIIKKRPTYGQFAPVTDSRIRLYRPVEEKE